MPIRCLHITTGIKITRELKKKKTTTITTTAHETK